MLILWALMDGLVVWIVLWALGVKAFDGFLVVVALVLGATAWTFVKPSLDRALGRS